MSGGGTALTAASTYATLVEQTVGTAGGHFTQVVTKAFYELSCTADLTAGVAQSATNVASLLQYWEVSTAATSEGVIIVDDGTDSYMWAIVPTSSASTVIDAAELTLIGIIHGVNNVTNGDFAVVA